MCCAHVLSYEGEAVLLTKTGRRRLFEAINVRSTSFGADKELSLLSLDTAKVQFRFDEFISFLR